jgi:hypothetical protein
MKTIKFLTYSLLTLLFISCGSEKVAIQDTTSVKEPFSSKEYFSDDDYYRAVSSATASTENIAHAKASDFARAELLVEIDIFVGREATSFDAEKSVRSKDFNSREYTLKIASYVEKNLPKAKTIGKIVGKTENGKYKAYRALELKKKDIVNMLNNISEKDFKILNIIKDEHNNIIEKLKKNSN